MKRLLQDEARRLRQNGMSVRDIAKTLNISKGTVSHWVRDIILTDEQIEALKQNQRKYGGQNGGAQTNRRKHKEARIAYQNAGRAKAREMRPLHMAGCMLYWAEGAKHRNKLYFVNSDTNMLLFYLRFLREELDVQDSWISLYIQCHAEDPTDIKRIEQYWTDLLGLPETSLRKTYVKKGSEYRRTKLENGLCGIMLMKTELVHHIYGAIQEYGGFENPDWLF
jgi:transcriptional regulator with XRE-family HTH domain